MEHVGLTPCSDESATGLYSEPDKPSPHSPTISLSSILILSYHQLLGIPSALFPWGFHTKI
jgi:hypothetical protein